MYAQKLFTEFFLLIIIGIAAFANWYWPLYLYFGDTPIYRFIWLGIFFILLDIFLELIFGLTKGFSLISDALGLSRDMHKISKSFYLIPKVSLSNNLKADYVVVGSSGVWLIVVTGDKGTIAFNGDELVQDSVILKGLITKSLEKAYSLASFLKEKLNKDLMVTPVITFSSQKVDLGSIPKIVRGVYLASRKDITSVIENTDIQLIDKNTIEEIYKILKK